MFSTKQIAITADGDPYIPSGHREAHSLGGPPKHELIVDLSSLDTPEETPLDSTDFVARLERTISGNPDIDAVTLLGTNWREGPSVNTWRALQGLQPGHLEIASVVMGTCELWNLEDLSPPWPLKTGGGGGGGGEEEGEDMLDASTLDGDHSPSFKRPYLPPCLGNLGALVLDYCYGLTFVPIGGARLTSLTIIENDGVATFLRMLEGSPGLTQTLRALALSSTKTAPHESGAPTFRKRLASCSALERLELALPGGNREYDWLAERESIAKLNLRALLERLGVKFHDSVDAAGNSNTDCGGCDQGTPAAPGAVRSFQRIDHYLDIARHLPASLVHLTFRGPASERMLQDLGVSWIVHARDASWLPNLHRIAFEVDLLDRMCGAEGVRKQLRARRAEFLEIMMAKGRCGGQRTKRWRLWNVVMS